MRRYYRGDDDSIRSGQSTAGKDAQGNGSAGSHGARRHVNQNTTVGEVMDEPLFNGKGYLLFPATSGWEPRRASRLSGLDLAWYTGIRPKKTVEVINFLLDELAAGTQVFFDIHSDAEKAADPAKRDTGLWFFPAQGLDGGQAPSDKQEGRSRDGRQSPDDERAGSTKGGAHAEKRAPFAIWNAGGGFAYVGAMHDSFPQALSLARRGLNAFALIYRPGWQTAMEDLARAISFVFAHADELGVDTEGYMLAGGSAGARMAANLGSWGPAAYGGDDLPRPSTVIMQYTGHSEYNAAGEPATYVCVGDRDGIASWRTMKARLDAVASTGAATEFHLFRGLSHGFGLGTGTVAEGWIDGAIDFWLANR